MALGFGEGGEQTAPLARAVIGGLITATLTTLFIVPSLFAVIQRSASSQSPSLDPEDPQSVYFTRHEPHPGPGQSEPRAWPLPSESAS
jgi:hypothetical protein